MLPLFNLIEIHDQIEGRFKSYAMAQSACPELFFFRNDMLLKMRGPFWAAAPVGPMTYDST